MTAFIETALYVSVTALFVLLFKQLFKNKLSAKWQVLIWLILAVRMIVPSLPQSRFSVFNAFDLPKEQKEVQTAFSENEQETDFNTVLPAIPETEAIKENPSETANFTLPTKKTAPTPAITPKSDTSRLLSADFIVPFIIRCGAAVLLLYFVLVYIINLAKIKKQGKKAKDNALQLLQDCKNTVGVKRKVSLVYYGKSPMLMGVIKPVIVLPEDFSDKEKQDIIIHELCHLKNGDIFALWLALFLLCTSWYNPIIWLCFFTFRRDIEVYCDSRVLEYAVNKKEYAELLVRTALKRNSFIAGTTSLQNGEKEVERRIKYMAYFKKPKAIWIMIIAVIAVIIGVLCLTNANNKKNNAKDKEESLYNSYSFDVEQCKTLVNIKDGCIVKETAQLKGKEFRYIVYHVQSHMSPDDLTPEYSYYNVFVFKDDDLIKIIEADADPRVYGFNTANTVLEADVNFDGKNDILVCTPDVGFVEYIIYLQIDNGFEVCGTLSKMDIVHVNTESKLFSGIYDNKESKSFRFSDNKIEFLSYTDQAYTDQIRDNTLPLQTYAEVEVYSAHHDKNAVEELEKTDGIIESTPNFFLKQTVTDEDGAYYCEVYDNSGNVIYSATSEKCPEFKHLEGYLYELRWSYGTFAWESVFFNVKLGYKTDVLDRPFHLENGVVTYLTHTSTFTDDGSVKTGKLVEIMLYDFYDRNVLTVLDAEFLKYATSYLIEYADDTHIQVTYYTENGQKEYKEVFTIPSITGALTEDDFKITYKGFTFDLDTTVDEVLEYFPTEEIENISYVSGSPTAKRICLSYPNAREPDINIICVQNLETGEQFIETIKIFSEEIATARGIKPKDDIHLFVKMNYGNGISFYSYGVNSGCEIYYFVTEEKIVFVDDADNDSLINYISFIYQPESLESHAIDIYQKSIMGESVSSLPINSEIKLLYASGAGAWGDYLHINPDGSFSGEYHDSDMGIADENEYPNGTVFIDRYSGKYGNFIKIDDCTYLLTVLEETHEFEPNAEWIEDGIRFVSTSPENPDIGTEYVLCLPGKPLSEIPKSVKEWELGNDSENTLTGYCLYPAQSPEIGYFQTA